jgi:serine/threonine protein kinase
MPKHLQVIAGPDAGKVFPLPEGDTVLVGRSRALECRLMDPYVSRVHCQVQLEGGDVVVIDFQSAAGTFVNGQRVNRQPLQPGDIIRIGDTQLQYLDTDAAEPDTVPPPPETGGEAPRPTDQLTDLVGKMLSHYQVGQVLARGQSGLVFHARDVGKDQAVALKVLWPEFSEHEEQTQRFVRAMQTALPLRHPNLVSVLGAGKTGSFCWVAMEYVEGESLTQTVQRIGTAGMLDWRNALRVAVHVGRALDFAHRQQIIHRNVTPMNIIVQASTRMAKLGDLMLAKALEGVLAKQITRPGELLGDLRYMAPERTYGAGNVDGRSDIFGLGATVYALLTGRPPFEGPTPGETLTKLRHGDLVRPKKYQLAIPDLFEGIVLKTLARRPEDRYATADSLVADLDKVARFQGLTI